MFKTIASAEKVTGSLSEPSKMPCFGYSIPAKYCVTGGKLQKVANSVCSKCYALKGRYVFFNVLNAMETRFVSLKDPLWIEAMAFQINKKEKSGFFRWHDSGEIQSLEHLEKIVDVCKKTPKIKHWLPTREYGIISEFFEKHGSFPKNLTVRLSAFMIDSKPPTSIAEKNGVVTSSVSTDIKNVNCPSSKQGNQCLNCRKCWNKNVKNISYLAH